jgi:hypothetical protein
MVGNRHESLSDVLLDSTVAAQSSARAATGAGQRSWQAGSCGRCSLHGGMWPGSAASSWAQPGRPCGQECGMFPNWPSPAQDPDRVNVVDASEDDDHLRVRVDHTTLEAIDHLARVITRSLPRRSTGFPEKRLPHPRLVPVGGDRVARQDDRCRWVDG